MTLLDAPVPLSPQAQRARLANLLQSSRRAQRISTGALARRTAQFTSADLRAYERGVRDVDSATVNALAALYDVDLELIAPPRTLVEVDLEHGQVAAAGVIRSIDRDDTLGAYLELVYELRGSRGPIPLREDDVEVLATTLDLDSDDVTDQLCELMHVSRNDAHKLLRSLAVGLPAGAAIAGLIVVGSLALRATSDDVSPTGSGSSDVTVTTVDTVVSTSPDPSAIVTTVPTAETTATTLAASPDSEAGTTRRPAARTPAASPGVEAPDTPEPQVEAPPTPARPQPPVIIGDPPVDVVPDDGNNPPRVEAPEPTPDPEIVAPG